MKNETERSRRGRGKAHESRVGRKSNPPLDQVPEWTAYVEQIYFHLTLFFFPHKKQRQSRASCEGKTDKTSLRHPNADVHGQIYTKPNKS